MASDSTVLQRWEPENRTFWQNTGRRVALRNLWISIPCLMLGFIVSVLWSMVTLNLPNAGFTFSKEQLFLLTALPQLSGATLRIFYAFMPGLFGGRRWTTFSTSLLLIPALWLGFAVQDPTTPYPVMLSIALLCGLGSGNFASSMANIAHFFPAQEKGKANGLNAGFGNLGVSVAQFLIPLAVTMPLFGGFGGEAQHYVKLGVEKSLWLQNAGFMWVPLIALATLAAWFGMDDMADAKSSFSEQAVIFKRRHNWLMCYLYLGTFGSFIGFAGAFALLTKTLFPLVPVAKIAFLGPLLGALIRPVGGMIADKVGGARVTMLVFFGMVVGAFGVLSALPVAGGAGNWPLFFGSFMALFVCAGLGNGSTYKMIPTLFVNHCQQTAAKDEASQRQARQDGVKESAAAAGFISAIGAYGGYFIPQSFGLSEKLTGGPQDALYCFMLFYVTCIAVTWWCFARRKAAMPC
ncbi:MAG: NarK family nitrate/nitrite MFS transporter [Paludibacterium sp.]|uniref:NarK family nitrate/nitrite MFS transporter n=1 Tax=Paludibacterium sp. TaxID=1917523 RepID=UPI0025D4A61F|nr:NarK family nitrate/nitrite MFS transporter [Paludibacterium sp.]MBV8046142.1 NarK family nitrate/nitrite MFS transporter [Paludibacterium sp.]MBV8648792.1 NarK family nitrate/nitrite MFS transporter [Paludibacterium sp.]